MNGWARNSRFWKVTPWFVLLAGGLSVYFNDPEVFTRVCMPWIALAGVKSGLSTYKGTEPTGEGS